MVSTSRLNRIGTLYVVAVPIGNPDDVTVRAIQILRNVDLIASEDPTVTQQLLAYHHIRATVTSYGPGDLTEKAAVLLQRLRRGTTIALVSDTGSPLVVDPGSLLVTGAHAQGIPVVPLPGPSVVIAALSVAGFPCDSFYFLGDLPRTISSLTRRLVDALERDVPTVVLCTEHSLARALQVLVRLAPRRPVVLAVSLTTSNEILIRGTASQVSRKLPDLHGLDLTIVLAGRNRRRRGVNTRSRAQSLSSRRINTRYA